MNIITTSKKNVRKIGVIIGAVLMIGVASAAQAASSSAVLNSQMSVDGASIPVHSGNAFVDASNYSSSYYMKASIKKSLAVLPDPTSWSRYISKSGSWYGTVSLSPSNYYPRAEGYNSSTGGYAIISGKVSIID